MRRGHPRLRWPHPHTTHSARPSEIKVVLPGAGVVGELHGLTPPQAWIGGLPASQHAPIEVKGGVVVVGCHPDRGVQ